MIEKGLIFPWVIMTAVVLFSQSKISLYLLSFFKLPMGVAVRLERVIRDFFWSGIRKRRG